MAYTITVAADNSVSLSNNASDKNRIFFAKKPKTLKEDISLEEHSILFTQEGEGVFLGTNKPMDEFVGLLESLNLLEEDIYEKIENLLPAISSDNQLYDAIKDHIVTDYCGDQISYITYSFVERCFRFLIALLTFPISIFRLHLVKEGEIGLVLRSGKPEILPPGFHVMLSPTTEFVATKRIDEPYIQIGAIQLIRIQEGQLGYAKDTERGRHLLLKPGFHIIRSTTTKFIKFLDLKKDINELDPGWLVSIRTGAEGLVYDQRGRLVMKKPGVHFIIPPSKLAKIISTQDTIMELPPCTYESSDYVPLKIKADVYYRLTNTEKVFEKIDPNSLEKYIRDTAIATLSGIIRNSTLKEIGQSSIPAYNALSTRQNLGTSTSSPPLYSFYSKVHDAFVKELQEHGIHEVGIDIFNIRIESLSIQDTELAKSISSQALLYAKTQAQLANMESENKIQEASAKQKASTQLIVATAEAEAIKIKAEAEAKAIKSKAEAEAEAIKARGEAQSQTLINKWEALAKGGEAVEKNLIAQQAALMLVSAEQLSGVQKIIYLPVDMIKGATGNLMNLGLFKQQNNEDLLPDSQTTLLHKEGSLF